MAGGLGAATVGPDPWKDRSYLMQLLLRRRGDPFRDAAEIALNQLNVDEAMAQRNEALGFRQQEADQHQLNFEANQRRQIAHDISSETLHRLRLDRDTEIDEQGAGLLQSMLKLDGALRRKEINKDQYDTALLDVGQQFPLGLRHPEAAKHYEFAVGEADKQNAFNLRREFSEASKLGGKYGIGVQADPDTGLPSIEFTRQAALKTDKGRNEVLGMMDTEMSRKYGITTGVSSLFNPVQPHTSPDEGKTIELPFMDRSTGAVGKLPVAAPVFEQMKAEFGPRYFQVNPTPAGAAQPTSQAAAPAAPTPYTPVNELTPQTGYAEVNIGPSGSMKVPLSSPYAAVQPTAAPTPKHLGRYNPQSGEFE